MFHNLPVAFLLSTAFALGVLAGCTENSGVPRAALEEAAPPVHESFSIEDIVEFKWETDEAFANAKGCMACHQVEAKKIGPAFRSVAEKYQGQGDAVSKLSRKVLEGGSGSWGEVSMPANKALGVREEEAAKLVHWVLSLK